MQSFLRKWHRWIAFPASIFLLFAVVTSILLAAIEFFDEEAALRERTRSLVSPVTTQTADAAFAAPLDKLVWQFKDESPPISFSSRKVTVDAKTGAVLHTEAYTDKPFLARLHSGEWFGDGGLVMPMLWGLSLVLSTVSGIIIYF